MHLLSHIIYKALWEIKFEYSRPALSWVYSQLREIKTKTQISHKGNSKRKGKIKSSIHESLKERFFLTEARKEARKTSSRRQHLNESLGHWGRIKRWEEKNSRHGYVSSALCQKWVQIISAWGFKGKTRFLWPGLDTAFYNRAGIGEGLQMGRKESWVEKGGEIQKASMYVRVGK